MSSVAPRPANEAQRLQVLHELALFNEDDDLIYRRKVDIMRRVFRTPIALLALADAEEQRFKVAFGLPMQSVPRDLAICSHALLPPFKPLVISDTRADPRSCQSPMVTGEVGVRFYAGAPLVLDGQYAVGTLCIMDRSPRVLSADEVQLLEDFAIQLAAVMQARLDALRQQQRTEALLAQSEALAASLRALQEIHRRGEIFARQGSWSLDMASGQMTISEGFASLLGFPPGTQTITHQVLRARIDPAFHAQIDAAFRRAVESKTVFVFDYPLADRNHGQQWLRARGDIVRAADGTPIAFVGVTQNITEEIRAKTQIESQQRLLSGLNSTLQSFLEQVEPRTVWQMMLDQLLAVTGAEFGFLGEVLFGIEPTPCLKIHAITNLSWSAESDALYERVMAGNMLFCNPNNLIGAVMQSREPVVATEVSADPRRGGFPPGHPAIHNYLGIPLYQGDTLVGVVAIGNRAEGVSLDLVDTLAPFLSTCAIMTVSLRQQAKQREYEQQLIESKAQADRANQGKSQFLSSMSHELRTPLNAILGFAQLMSASRREPLSDKQRGFVEQILKAGQHLLSLVNDVLNLAKIEAGEITLSPEPLNLAELAQEATDMLLDTARSQQIELNNELRAAQWACADHTRARQVLLNLMSNAIKYNRPQGRVTLNPLPARTRADGLGWIGFAVQDTGLGIPKDKQHRLFRAFERLGRENSAIEGTGIGLMITRQLIERMYGELSFESTEGEGTTFFVWLPAYQPAEPGDCGSARATAAEGAAPGTAPDRQAAPRLRVLYIEDNAANRTLMADIAEDRDDIELILAEDGEQGLELALTRAPDLVLMDINLPGISGQQAAARLKKWVDTRHVPIVALSADATAPMRLQAERNGLFDRYLTKPFNLGDINALFDELISQKAPR
ncbi:ATP-binding protein [Halothiobacillus sp. DCM-1]|uniref:ATP-binding protein n=1 Tax=Halothiobacillus sp. DCM-1 TaxID=3112558 RepID=UPI00324A9D25